MYLLNVKASPIGQGERDGMEGGHRQKMAGRDKE